MKHGMIAGLVVVAALSNGCAGAVENAGAWDETASAEEIAAGEQVDVLEEAIGEFACRNEWPDVVFNNGTPELTLLGSPNNYGNEPNDPCPNGYIVKVNNYVATADKRVSLQYADTAPANFLTCESIIVRMDSYKLESSGYIFDATREGRGEWADGKCTIGTAIRKVPSSGTWKFVIEGIRNVQTWPKVKVRLWTSGQ